MRREKEILAQILDVADNDERIRAVLLTGSRANPNVVKDIFQDFDIIYIVTHIETFIRNKQWIDVFGERVMLQLPEEMSFGDNDNLSFHFLMLFKDSNRIDLTLFPVEKLRTSFKADSLTTLLLDKDNLFEQTISPNETDYLIMRPTEKEFFDCCNEFWWVSTYVSKGLWRNQIPYAKKMMEIPVRTMFLKMIEWYIGTKKAFSVSFGKDGQYMKQYISPDLYNQILLTYPDSSKENIWNSLFLMTHLFDDFAVAVANEMKFHYKKEEAKKVTEYLKSVYDSS